MNIFAFYNGPGGKTFRSSERVASEILGKTGAK
jgi:hypothetical protein